MYRVAICTALAVIMVGTRAHAGCTAQSAADRAHLVELYTSEGCDSCPPAERWMSTLRKHPDLIGLEYHVDYWDDSGWRDPFSDHAYTVRQQAQARRGNNSQIFTPQIWLDGHVWRNWPKGEPPALAGAPAPTLRLSANADDAVHLSATVEGVQQAADYRIFAALSEVGLSERVRGGENRGKTLNHDEVVRSFAGPLDAPRADIELKIPAKVDVAHASIVAFVENASDGSVVQALRVPLSECRK